MLTQLRQAQDELADFTRQLEKTYGAVAGQVFERKRIQASLPADTALIGWLDIPGQSKAVDPNGEHWAVLLRSSGDPIFVRLYGSGDKHAWTDADTQLPSELRTALQSPRGQWQPLAERLRLQRLQPLAKHLQGVRHLIVLPSTALAGVPVEVLADKYTVSYAHSGSMHAHLRQQPKPTGKGLFALADPVFDTPVLAEKPQPLPKGGVLLTVVVPGSNAAQAGLKPNDVLLRYGDTDLAGPADFKPLPQCVFEFVEGGRHGYSPLDGTLLSELTRQACGLDGSDGESGGVGGGKGMVAETAACGGGETSGVVERGCAARQASGLAAAGSNASGSGIERRSTLRSSLLLGRFRSPRPRRVRDR